MSLPRIRGPGRAAAGTRKTKPMETKTKRRILDEAGKRVGAALLLQGDQPIQQLAIDPGVRHWNLGDWKKLYGPVVPVRSSEAQEIELRALHDILKKRWASWSNPDRAVCPHESLGGTIPPGRSVCRLGGVTQRLPRLEEPPAQRAGGNRCRIGSPSLRAARLPSADHRQPARIAVFEHVEVFYNRQHLHRALGFKSPVDFENQTNKLTRAAALSDPRIRGRRTDVASTLLSPRPS